MQVFPVTFLCLKPDINATLSAGTLTYLKKDSTNKIPNIISIGIIISMFMCFERFSRKVKTALPPP